MSPRPDLPGTLLDGRVYAAIVALLALALVFPILLSHHLPMWDADGHIAHIALLKALLFEGHDVAGYAFNSLWLPNAGFDGIGLLMEKLVDAETAARIFFGFSQLVTLSGIVLLSRVLIGRWSLFPFASAIVLYNLITAFGFLNYLFGVGLVFLFLAARVWALRNRPALGFAIGALAAIGLLFAHLEALGIYGVLWAGIALDDLIAKRTTVLSALGRAADFIPAFVILMTMRAAGGVDFNYMHHTVQRKAEFLVKTFLAFSPVGDIACLVAVAILVGLMFRAKVRVSSLGPGIAMLMLIYVVLPSRVQGSEYADIRLSIAILYAVFAGLDVRVRPSSYRAPLIALFVALLAAKQMALAISWRQLDGPIDRVTQALDRLPANAVIADVNCVGSAGGSLRAFYAEYAPPTNTLVALSAADQLRFYVSLWARPEAHPVRVQPDYQAFYDLQDFLLNSGCHAGPAGALEQLSKIMAAKKDRGQPVPPVYLVTWGEAAPREIPAYAQLVESIGIGNLYQVGAP